MENIIKQRMSIMKKAVQMHGEEGVTAVVEAYDAMWGRIISSEGSAPTSHTFVGELVEKFIAECLELTADDRKLQAKDLYVAFIAWCKKEQVTSTPSQRAFGTEMVIRFERIKQNKYWYVGVALQKQEQAA
ncbi:MAG: primase-like DNA-binding domain-containing protein [Halodesulfovibrio sp.]|uniref:primase-like DNA-binding domain-containing protein n=1 Tax=Halodesulfovibrio sp. TaxID=1912772 RepID=UPI00359CC2C7